MEEIFQALEKSTESWKVFKNNKTT